ncbi:Srb8 RNA polymerase II mediator complex subunit [Candida orthopsilosis Co 90-125]|uniref:Mediator of RNA polymerase II transcription subunit 12 n=1 Tax=Candida orthopsilosis (strain 90-125) TaxID=1136231 RepID=H8X7V7_CANO9|nr:Srb8 RNA polymerase II mediator complex subunit [Candida orthopsilosis Co 90-125]CCG23893.1 Srb8 RNA polymerase II mediator complex subunit [Candida orthopsilosis Co 90-125]
MTSKLKSKNKLLSSHKKSSLTKSSTKDELLALKYSMDRPSLPIYALEDTSKIDVLGSKGVEEEVKDSLEYTYPDFIPWKDHTQTSKGKQEPDHQQPDEHTYLSKGYFEAPHVGNEYYSGRNLVSATLFQSNENCLTVVNELSRFLTNAYKSRNENINKIRYNAGHFKIPQKVTLTASKRDNWLNELSNPNVPLKKIGEKIPHGIRSRVLIDLLCTRSTPINRALWFTKCVLFSELLALRRKYQSRISAELNSPEKFELHWLQEWTQQVAGYVVKVAQDMMHVSEISTKEYYMKKLSYLREFISSLYVETLLDKPYFLSLLLKPLREGFPLDSDAVSDLIRTRQIDDEENYDVSIQDELQFEIDYGQRFASLVWIKTFWNDITAIDYLAKELSESLLLNHFYLTKLSQYPKWFLPEHLRENLTNSLRDMVVYLFKRNTNIFVIPNNWALTNESLATILAQEMLSLPPAESKKLADQLELINYRNESLIINLSKSKTIVLSGSDRPQSSINLANGNMQVTGGDNRYRGTLSKTFKILEDLDHLRVNEKLAQQLQPRIGIQSNENWKQNLKTVLFWCVSPWRYSEFQNESILIVCNFLKRSLSVQVEKSVKVEFESEILECIFTILESNAGFVDSKKLYILVNELYQLKMITIASYIRKLIASGVFFTTSNESQSLLGTNISTQNHLHCLMNLPVLNNKQCDSILRKWTAEGLNFKEAFESMKQQLSSMILDRVFSNKDINLSPRFEEQWNSFRVGLKFLLVNWLTDEFKARLVSSPKLVVFTQDILAKLYKFYAISDNLPVFFKIVVQVILRNESRMAILYLDGLYFISRLIMRHFKLLKQFSDSSNRSTVANLFRLIMQNYKDLSQREFVIYNFQQVWSFIDAVTEKDVSPSRKRKWDVGSDFTYYGIPSRRRDNFETPMQIQSVDLAFDHTPRLAGSYSLDDFRNDLTALRTTKITPLRESEVKELKIIVDNTSHESLLSKWFSKAGTISESSEIAIVKLWKHFTIDVAQERVDKIIKSTLNEILHSESELKLKVLMIKKLVVYDIVVLKEVLSLLDKIEYESLLHQMLLEPNFSENSALTASQYQLYNTSVHLFKEKNKQQYSRLVLSGLGTGNLQNNDYFLNHKEWLKRFLSQGLVTHGEQMFKEVFVGMSRDNCLELLNLCLHRSEKSHIRTFPNFEESIEEINEFNLPFYQVLLCVLSLTLDTGDKDATKTSWEELIKIFSRKTKSTGDFESFIFGSLFYWVPWEHKLIVLEILEETMFSQQNLNNAPMALTLDGIDISRVIVGFIDIFLSTLVNTVASPPSFVSKFKELLARIENQVNGDLPEKDQSAFNTLLSIILKVIIIHKPSLCTFIAKNINDELAENLVRTLIQILDSKYMKSQNQKLRVLFHDLLLLMKTSVNEEVTTSTEQSLHQQHNLDESPQKEPIIMESLATASQVQRLFAIPELDEENPFKDTFNDDSIKCAIMLDKKELIHGGDANHINDSNLKLQIPKTDSLNIPAFVGNMLSNEKNEDHEDSQSRTYVRPFILRSYELLEDTSYSLNDGCINLSLFNSYVSKENPP